MRPSLTISEQPTYSTPFCEDPWPGDDEDDYHNVSPSSSRTSSSSSHVLPESAFMGADGKFLVDPYLGFGDIAQLASNYLIKTFHAKEETTNTRSRGQPKLSIFIAQLIYLTAAPYNAVIASLILLQRFRAKLAATHNDESLGYSGHMLWLGAFTIACNEDNMRGVVPNAGRAAYWSEISLFTQREVDEVYRELWDELEGNVTVFPSYASALEKLKNPIQVPASFGWQEEHLWKWGGEDDDDGESSEDEGKGSALPVKTSRQAPLPAAPRAKSYAKAVPTSPPPSPRTRALRSRLASIFKKKA